MPATRVVRDHSHRYVRAPLPTKNHDACTEALVGTRHRPDQVDSSSDINALELSSEELAHFCGPDREPGGCELRTALAYAAGFIRRNVTLTITTRTDLVLAQAQPISVSG